MSKHFSIFTTESQYQAVKDTLDYPNVSLIETSGDIKYSIFLKKTLYNAPFGSLIVADVNDNNNLFWLEKDDYNLTDYPLSDYKPIAICVKTSEEATHKNAVFMSLYPASNISPYYKNPATQYDTQLYLGFYDVNIPELKSQTIDSKSLNDVLNDTDGSDDSQIMTAARNFVLPGTNVGDWMMPSFYDCTSIRDNWSVFKNNIEYYSKLTFNLSSWNASKLGNYVEIGYTQSSNSSISGFRIGNGPTSGWGFWDDGIGRKSGSNNATTRLVFYSGVQEV